MGAQGDPRISVILPSFNRSAFLAGALASIQAQTFTDWELIVVDDGSTDDTGEAVAALAAQCARPVRYLRQANQGPAGARNSGVDIARGAYLAFFDSDDLWLPHHLAACVAALDREPAVDWVYGACQVVDLDTGRELDRSSFYPRGTRHPFLSLSTRDNDGLRVITDPRATECMIADGLMCGLQCSVMRRRVFDAVRLPPQRTVHDQIFVVQVLKAGFVLGYFDNVHTVYRVHDASVSARGREVEKAVIVLHELVDAWEALSREIDFTPRERRTLRRRLADEWFWTLGYSIHWRNGQRPEAFAAFHQGLRHWPWNPRQWKTYAVAAARRALSA